MFGLSNHSATPQYDHMAGAIYFEKKKLAFNNYSRIYIAKILFTHHIVITYKN